jgi:hypothetical protein
MPNMPSAVAATICFFILFFLGVVRVMRMPPDAARVGNRRCAFDERERGHPGFARKPREGRVLRDV